MSNKHTFGILLTFLIFTGITSAYASNHEPSIYPVPKQLVIKSNSNFVLNNNWVIVADLSNKQSKFNADYLKRHFQTEFSVQVDVISLLSPRALKAKRILLVSKDIDSGWVNIIQDSVIDDTVNLGDEGYRIDTVSDKNRKDIIVVGNKPQGVFYGIQSMLMTPGGSKQLILPYENNSASFPSIYVEDWPDRPLRGAFGLFSRDNGFFGDINDLADAFEWIDVAAKLKMNTIVTGDKIDELAGLDEIYDYARQRYINPIPFLRGFNGTYIFALEDPRTSEGIAVKSESFVCKQDGSDYRAQPVIPIDQTNRLQNTDFEQDLSGWVADSLDLWSIDSQHSGQGLSSLSFQRTSADSNQSKSIIKLERANLISVDPGEVIEVSINTKSLNVEGNLKAKLTVKQLNSSYKRSYSTDEFKTSVPIKLGTKDWSRYEQAVLVAEDAKYLELTLTVEANTTGNIWFDDIQIRRLNGALINVIRTADTDVVVRDKATGETLTNTVDYNVIDGDLKFLSNVDGRYVRFYSGLKPFEISCHPDEVNYPAGRELEIDYDFVVQIVKGQFATSVMSVNDSLTYSNHILPYIKEMVTALGPKDMLYSGSSEVKGMNRDSRNKGMENYQIMQKDTNITYDYLKSLVPDALIYIWDDMFSPWHNGGEATFTSRWGGGKVGATEPLDPALPRVTDNIPTKDLIIWSWYYSDTGNKIFNSPAYYESKGFNWVGSPFKSEVNINIWGDQMINGQSNLGLILWSPYYTDPANIVPAAGKVWNLGTSN